MKKIICIYGVFLLLFDSCQKVTEINTDIPFQSKVVVTCFPASGDSILTVSVTRTTPVTGTTMPDQPVRVTDATVWITQNSLSFPLSYDLTDQVYKGSMNPERVDAGETFTCHVKADGETITGMTTIPGPRATTISVIFDSTFSAETNTYTYKANLHCTVLEEGTQYLFLYPILVYSDSTRYPMGDFEANRIRTITGKGSFNQEFSGMFYATQIPAVRLEVMVITCDEQYARYYNRIGFFDLSSAGSLFVEPVITRSNMSNHIGLMGSMNINRTEQFKLQ